MAELPQIKHTFALFKSHKCPVEFLKSVMVMSVYAPLKFPATRFVVVAGVLIRALIEMLRPTPNVDDKPDLFDDDLMREDLRPHSIQRPYISYSI